MNLAPSPDGLHEQVRAAQHSGGAPANSPDEENCSAQELGRLMRLHRRQQGLSLRAVAKSVGLSAHSGIVEYESGRRILPEDLLHSYERALHLPSGYLRGLRQEALRERAERETARPAPSVVPGSSRTDDRLVARVAVMAAVTATVMLIIVESRRIKKMHEIVVTSRKAMCS
jgi:transcriptional regulator with XRE-family HTH domain